MASLYIFRFSLRKNDVLLNSSMVRYYCSYVKKSTVKNLFKVSLFGVGIGIVLGTGYAFNKVNTLRQNLAFEGTQIKIELLKQKPNVKLSRKVISHLDKTGLKVTLYQYQTCPFCCKVRVLLDYYGLSYDVVEVNPVLKKEINWSSYKKVPILLVEVKNGFQPLYDSSMIVSVLSSYLQDKSYEIKELSEYYPMVAVHDEKGIFKHEIINKYFLMSSNSLSHEKDLDSIIEERKWRKWVDDTFIHTLSPNVYRTLTESFKTFKWFSQVGNWEEYFPLWENAVMVYVGAVAMWFISKKLKKRYNLKEDVRESFYDEINVWLQAIQTKGGKFMGGNSPDLSDLAVYGVLKSIEGCDAFKDALEFTNLSIWFDAITELVEAHAGSVNLKNL